MLAMTLGKVLVYLTASQLGNCEGYVLVRSTELDSGWAIKPLGVSGDSSHRTVQLLRKRLHLGAIEVNQMNQRKGAFNPARLALNALNEELACAGVSVRIVPKYCLVLASLANVWIHGVVPCCGLRCCVSMGSRYDRISRVITRKAQAMQLLAPRFAV